MNATTIGVSLYPEQIDAVDQYADELKKSGDIESNKKQVRSIALRRIITEWRHLKVVTSIHHTGEVEHHAPAIADLADGSLTAYPPHSTRVNILRDSPLMELIEQSDLPESVGDGDA
jgi:hypothetical protein